uniref:Uncharacterized protein LOC117363797 n=1 Tax=Geotrypetes seraphini TaxID=260995 RepID=A0A6P8RS36_GEOSA|nr:uncharacterized protein LOC117363797 [Geotrypetes seraphini]
MVHYTGFDKSQLSHQSLLGGSSLKTTNLAVPPGRQGRAMDKFGRCLYQSSTMTNRILSYNFVFTSYLKYWVNAMQTFFKYLLEHLLTEFQHMHSTLAQPRIHMAQAAYDAFEISSRATALSVAIRHLAWLHPMDMDPNLQDQLANIPCQGSELFDDSIEAITKCLSEYEKSSNPNPSTDKGYTPSPSSQRRFPQKAVPDSRPPLKKQQLQQQQRKSQTPAASKLSQSFYPTQQRA